MNEEQAPPEHAMEELVDAARHDETKRGLLKLARMDVLEVTWDEENDDIRWSVTELGLDLCQRDEMEEYLRAAARPGIAEQPG